MPSVITATPARILASVAPPARIGATVRPPAAIGARLSVGQGPTGPQGPAGSTELPYTAGAPLSGHRVLTLGAGGQAVHADAATTAHAGTVVGISRGAAVAGDEVIACGTGGVIEHSGWSFVADAPVLVGLDGALVQTLPAGAAWSQTVGIALTPMQVLVALQPPIFLAS